MCDEQRNFAKQAQTVRGGYNRPGYPQPGGASVGYASEGYANQVTDTADREPTLRERIQQELDDLDRRRTVLLESLAAIDANPEFEKHDATRRAITRAGLLRY